jgi:hypothetical protein
MPGLLLCGHPIKGANLDEWRNAQPVPPSRTAVVLMVVTEFIRNYPAKAMEGTDSGDGDESVGGEAEPRIDVASRLCSGSVPAAAFSHTLDESGRRRPNGPKRTFACVRVAPGTPVLTDFPADLSSSPRQANPLIFYGFLAGEPGFEPRLAESEFCVIHDSSNLALTS